MIPALHDKTAIVTGAATRIGKAIALALGRAGASVVVNHLDAPDSAEDLAREIAWSPAGAISVAGHVSVRTEFDAVVAATIERFGRWECSSTTPASPWSSRSAR